MHAEQDTAADADLEAQSERRRAGGAEQEANRHGIRGTRESLTMQCRRDTHMAPTWTCDPPLCLMHRMGGVLFAL